MAADANMKRQTICVPHNATNWDRFAFISPLDPET
jgi:hypothetical protein